MVKKLSPAAPVPAESSAAIPMADEFHGVGGSYVIGEDGIRRQVEAPTEEPATKE